MLPYPPQRSTWNQVKKPKPSGVLTPSGKVLGLGDLPAPLVDMPTPPTPEEKLSESLASVMAREPQYQPSQQIDPAFFNLPPGPDPATYQRSFDKEMGSYNDSARTLLALGSLVGGLPVGLDAAANAYGVGRGVSEQNAKLAQAAEQQRAANAQAGAIARLKAEEERVSGANAEETKRYAAKQASWREMMDNIYKEYTASAGAQTRKEIAALTANTARRGQDFNYDLGMGKLGLGYDKMANDAQIARERMRNELHRTQITAAARVQSTGIMAQVQRDLGALRAMNQKGKLNPIDVDNLRQLSLDSRQASSLIIRTQDQINGIDKALASVFQKAKRRGAKWSEDGGYPPEVDYLDEASRDAAMTLIASKEQALTALRGYQQNAMDIGNMLKNMRAMVTTNASNDAYDKRSVDRRVNAAAGVRPGAPPTGAFVPPGGVAPVVVDPKALSAVIAEIRGGIKAANAVNAARKKAKQAGAARPTPAPSVTPGPRR